MSNLDEQKIADQRKDGYQNGLTWPDEWESQFINHGVPGGPYVCGYLYPAMHAQDSAENKAWREGWVVGHAEKIDTKRSNPLRRK